MNLVFATSEQSILNLFCTHLVRSVNMMLKEKHSILCYILSHNKLYKVLDLYALKHTTKESLL